MDFCDENYDQKNLTPSEIVERATQISGNNYEPGMHKIQNFVSTKEHKTVNNRLQAPIYFQNCSNLTINLN